MVGLRINATYLNVKMEEPFKKPRGKYCLLIPFSMDGKKVPSEKLGKRRQDLCSINQKKIKEQGRKRACGVFLQRRPTTRLLSRATFIDHNKKKEFKTTSDVRKRL
jgi:hypothetical protein